MIGDVGDDDVDLDDDDDDFSDDDSDDDKDWWWIAAIVSVMKLVNGGKSYLKLHDCE